MREFYFEGVPYRGKPTKVFALYGAPAGADANHKVPGIILVHGAGGTAFIDWVRLWVARGYAAIAFDTEGEVPIGTYNHWTLQPEGGPRRADVAALKSAIPDQWMYHAVADTMLAHSLLASFPEVDASRIGITGISWGGVVTSLVASVDDRLKFAVPVYGCGYISDPSDDGSQFVGPKAAPEQVASWRRLWDPANFLSRAKIPMLWVDGTNDFAFTMRAVQLSYRTAPGPHTLCLRVRMKHAHNGPGETPGEILSFADSVVKKGIPLAEVARSGRNGNVATLAYESPVPIQSATLNFTKDNGKWQTRVWDSVPAKVTPPEVSATIPDGTAAYYFTLIDKRGLIVTSEYESSAP